MASLRPATPHGTPRNRHCARASHAVIGTACGIVFAMAATLIPVAADVGTREKGSTYRVPSMTPQRLAALLKQWSGTHGDVFDLDAIRHRVAQRSLGPEWTTPYPAHFAVPQRTHLEADAPYVIRGQSPGPLPGPQVPVGGPDLITPNTSGAAPAARPAPPSASASAARSTGGVPPAASPEAQMVVDVRVVGNETVTPTKIQPHIRTRRGRPLDTEMVESDVQRMNSTRWFIEIKPLYQQVPGGVAVIFQVVERPSVKEIHFIGNDYVRIKVLKKQLDLKVGGPIDPYAVEDGRRKIEDFYRERGFHKVRIDIAEGDKVGDRRVVYVINEGPKQKIGDVEFFGNMIATDARLKTQIQSKTPILHIPHLIEGFKGFYDEEKLEQDVDKLTAYYRSLGFFQAKVNYEPIFKPDQKWATVRFVIDEGIRYKVRSVTFMGNKKYTVEQLAEKTKLAEGQYFDQMQMDADLQAVRDEYGSIGHVFADIQAEPRFLEEPGQLDLVYSVAEGAKARVGKITVNIKGDHPHTKQNAVLNQLSFSPGDVIDIREIRSSERRLKLSGIFAANIAQGQTPPQIVYSPPGTVGAEEGIAEKPRRNRARGQSPDPQPYQAAKPSATPYQRPYVPQQRREAPAPNAPSATDALPQHFRYPTPARSEQSVAPPYPSVPPQPGRFDPRLYKPMGMTRPASSAEPSMPTHRAYQHSMPILRGETNSMPVVRGQSPELPGGDRRWGAPTAAPMQAGVSPRSAARPNLAPQAVPPPVVRAQYTAPWQGGSMPATTPQRYTTPGAMPQVAPATAMQQPYPAQSVPLYPPANNYQATPGYPPQSVTPSVGSYQPPNSYPAPGGYAPAPPSTATQGVPYGEGPPAYLQSAPPVGAPPSNTQPPPSAYGPPVEGYDTPGELFPESQQFPNALEEEPTITVPVDVNVEETQTGRLMFGVGINSDAGLVGSVIMDEQNFDWRRLPRSWDDIRNATAWRGAGQQLRIEAVPGSQLQRYMVTFREPYLADTPVSFTLSGFLFDRRYFEWDEQRIGGRTGLGYQFSPDLSGTLTIGGQSVKIRNPAVPTPQELADVVGDNELWTARAALVHDTRDSAFLPTEGHRIELAYEQGFGQFDYPRGTIEVSQYFLVHERPDRSGRQTIMLRTAAGFSGSQTPIFENFFAGGFSTLRGFDFRGASPRELGIVVGGEFQWLNTAEYMFPITADDMLRGVIFCDFGTVEQNIELNADNFRVAPGFGLRISVAALGPAPIALDFAVPVAHAPGDNIQNFSFFVGLAR